jgi:hypothetical protein
MKALYLFIIAMALSSCDFLSLFEDKGYHEIEVIIKNLSDTKVDSVKFYVASDYDLNPWDSLLFEDIHPDTEIALLWSNIKTCKYNGTYVIKAFFNDTILETYGGYIPVGAIFDKQMRIWVSQDSINFSSITFNEH